MPSNPEYQKFLTVEMPQRLSKLKEDSLPKFGLMTPQHMVEHLILMTKMAIRIYGQAPETPTEGQLKFKKFKVKEAFFQRKKDQRSGIKS